MVAMLGVLIGGIPRGAGLQGTIVRRTSLFFGQTTPYNSFKALMLLGRKGRGTPAYILRKLVSVGKGVPNAFRIAACRSSGVGKRTTAVPWMW